MLALAAALAFLLGSIPSGFALSLLIAGRDIRRYGSGNIGASNAASLGGLRLGLLVGLLDVIKGVLAVLIGRVLGLDHVGLAIVAGIAVLGHDFSLFMRLRGGKGVATSFGVYLVLAPFVGLCALVAWVAFVWLTRYASAGSLLALALLPVLCVAFRQPLAYTLLGVGLFLLAAAKHYQNIGRLVQGNERKVRLPGSTSTRAG